MVWNTILTFLHERRLSIYSESVYVEAMLDAGASGYVVKTSAAHDLVPAIECAAAGKRFLSPETGVARISNGEGNGKNRDKGTP